MSLTRVLLAGLVAAIVIMPGCGKGEPLTSVAGKISYRGQVVTHGAIQFFGGENRKPVSALIHSDGTYAIEVPPGSYRVGISSPPVPPPGWKEGMPVPDQTPSLPDGYARPAISGLVAEVPENSQPETIDFDLR